MAKQKQDSAAKPDSGQAGAGQAPEPASELTRTGLYQRKTFLITEELETRVLRLAAREHVGQNELVRYLLAWALEQVEEGKHQLPATPVDRRTLGV